MTFAGDGRRDYRRFECTAGSSDKFWEIRRVDRVQFVYFGRRGTSGQVRTKEYADAEEAERKVSNLIRSKIAKGYAEVVVLGSTMKGALKPKPGAKKKAKPKPIVSNEFRAKARQVGAGALDAEQKLFESIVARKQGGRSARNPVKPKPKPKPKPSDPDMAPSQSRFKRRLPRIG